MKMNLKNSGAILGEEYRVWVSELKSKVRQAQVKAAVKVNKELLLLYWSFGKDIVAKQVQSKWGDGLLVRLSRDLMAEFPEMHGFSLSNLKYMKQWYSFYSLGRIGQQSVGQLGKQTISHITRIPWGHNIVIISKKVDSKNKIERSLCPILVQVCHP